MTRLIAILILALAGLPGLGLRDPGAEAGSSLDQTRDAAPKTVLDSCCSDLTDAGYCPMSGGPCACEVSPTPDTPQRPEAPMPRPGRDSLTAVPSAAVGVVTVREPVALPRRGYASVLGLLAGRSNNEIQALLGVWQT